MRKVKVAATQMACTWNREETLNRAEALVREAAAQGANIILLQELFETPYFCQQERYEHMGIATPLEANAAITHFRRVAKELQVVLPISFFEKNGNVGFNSIAMIDADGSILGVYRKVHIPDGPAYEEKFYFTPGDLGFIAWKTKYGTIGVGICWDQWFPETARAMALLGAEILLFPTAIGSETILPYDSQPHWKRCMQGHAAANFMPVVASNRIGTEEDITKITFYGSSFIADETGEIVKMQDRETQGVIVHEFDLDEIEKRRREWGIFRDRRPDMYKILLTHGKDA